MSISSFINYSKKLEGRWWNDKTKKAIHYKNNALNIYKKQNTQKKLYTTKKTSCPSLNK